MLYFPVNTLFSKLLVSINLEVSLERWYTSSVVKWKQTWTGKFVCYMPELLTTLTYGWNRNLAAHSHWHNDMHNQNLQLHLSNITKYFNCICCYSKTKAVFTLKSLKRFELQSWTLSLSLKIILLQFMKNNCNFLKRK